MKAIVLNGIGGVENLVYKEVAKPTLKANEVLIKVKAFSINPIDIKTRKGKGAYPKIKDQNPIILGWDVSGEVVAIGSDTTKFKVGDEVFGMIDFPGQGGAYAEYTVSPQTSLVLKPKSTSHFEAAATSLAALTAWQGLVHEAKISNGQRVLIHAAAGGVGHFAVQIAKFFGSYVIATASGKNREFLKEMGVDQFIDYTKVRFDEMVKDIDVVFDGVGGEVALRSLQVLGRTGQMISIPSGMDESWKKVSEEQRLNARSYLVHSSGEDMEKLAILLNEKRLIPHISMVYSFDQIDEAHRQIETGSTRGKIVVEI